MNKEVEQLLNKCDNCKLKECIGCEFTWTDIQKIRKYIEELEQKQFILDKVTDKLKEDIKETTLPCVIIGGRRNSKTLEYGKKLGRIETLKEILNIIEGEKNNGRLL